MNTLKKENLLHLHNIRKTYPDKNAKTGLKLVLDDIDLSVKEGEFCTVVGPSGCGKSTLLRLILGQEKQTSGTLLLDNKVVGIPDARRGIVYQDYSLFEHKTVLENVMSFYTYNTSFLSRKFNKEGYNKAKEEALSYIERVGLAEAVDRYPSQLSGGMRQRVAIIQSLIAKPQILLMDEPFSALDPETREELQLFTKEIAEENNITVFFVSHDLEEALFLGTRLLVVSQYYQKEGRCMKNQGSRIVSDTDISHFSSQASKATAEFGAEMQNIRKVGFSPEYLQHIEDFDLKHKDSFSDEHYDELNK
jgi:NitT/TauT family transport system ATP-binding protein